MARYDGTNARVAITRMYHFGEGRPVDLADAAGWYRRAPNLGEMFMLGLRAEIH